MTALMTAIDGREVLLDDYSSKQIKIAFNPWAAEGEAAFEVQTPVHVKDRKWIPDISVVFKPGFDDYESRFLPARRKMMAAKIRKYYAAL